MQQRIFQCNFQASLQIKEHVLLQFIVYNEWYKVVKTQLFKFISYTMKVANNLMMGTTKAETYSC